MKLNSQQQQAVDIKQGPALIIAGAGTGKTSVIVQKILQLINNGVSPESILALTFTEKAASEMIERVSLQSNKSLLSMPIYTFNGFGSSLLSEFAIDIGLPSSLRLLGETGQLVFMRDHLDEFNLDYFSPVSRPDSQLEHIRDYISKLKQHIILPNEYLDFSAKMPTTDDAEKLEKKKHTELAHAYNTYIQLCRSEHVIDYDDQIFVALELLRTRPNVKKILQKRYTYIVVDEFQDTNPMQSALLDAIVNEQQSIMAVGDDDQSIYGWRGATLQNILSFSERYSNTKNIVLQQNYRSTQAILDAAYTLIQHNNPYRLEHTTGLDKNLISSLGQGNKPIVRQFSHIQSELQWIVKDISDRLTTGQDPGSIAVLARKNSDIGMIHDALLEANVAHVVIGTSTSVFDTLTVKQLLQILGAVLNPHDNSAVYHTFSSAAFQISPQLLATASHKANQEHIDLLEVLKQSENQQIIKAITLFNSWTERQHLVTVGDIAYAIISETGWTERLYEQATQDDVTATEFQGLGLFFELLRDFTKTSNHPSLAMFIESLPLLKSSVADIKDDTELVSKQQVNVMSIHKSKGLEWDTVYIMNCTEGTMPLTARKSSLQLPEGLVAQTDADDHLAEERRLLYVAITRAAKEVFISYSDTKTGNRGTKPSRFINEISDKNYVYISEDTPTEALQKISPILHQQNITLPDDMLQNDTLVLSVSQVATWLKCPQEFYYIYVLKTPQKPDPTRGYGTLIHACIEKLHKAKASNTHITFDELKEFYDESWPKAGYMSAKHRERAMQQGIKTIQRIYERFTQTDEPVPNITESSFRVAIPDTNVVLKGRIDAVFETQKGSIIVDYKTGQSITSPEKAKQRATASDQLTMYALAWQLMHDELPAVLQLDFVETGYTGSVSKKQQSITTMMRKISDIQENINKGIYPEGDHAFCTHPY